MKSKVIYTYCKLLQYLGFYLLSISVMGQNSIQASIEAGAADNSVLVTLLPSMTSTELVTNFQFAIGIPVSEVSPAPSPIPFTKGVGTISTGVIPGVSGLIPSITVNNTGLTIGTGGVLITTQDVDGVSHYVYTFIFNGSSSTNFTAGVEEEMVEVAFNSCVTMPCPTNIKLVSLPDGGSTFQDYFYINSDHGDITNQTASFYSDTGGAVSNGGCTDYTCESYVGLGAPIDLPIELVLFEPRINQCDMMLYWETATEKNFSYYQIEASKDGKVFEPIGQQKPGSPNSTTKRTYKYSIPSNLQDHYFRLKSVDLDESFEYSPVVYAKAPCEDKYYEVLLYPNPNFTSELMVDVKSPEVVEKVEMHLLDAFGKVIRIQKIDEVQAGSNKLRIETSDLPTGTYFIKLIGIEQLQKPLKFIRSNF
ncbi:MAG: T9SS type A sorting domain-containing protein [Saprospiraceae bacterium]|nr:T9SS type A sorting domain-containing protein [Saprospiraceae bacterium]